MIKAILVPATGSSSDTAVFASALAVARKFAAHIDFLHVRVIRLRWRPMATDGGGAVMISGLVDRIDEEASQRETTAGRSFRRSASASSWRSPTSPRLSPFPRRGGFGKSATRTIGSQNMRARPISSSWGARPTAREFRSIRSKPLSSTVAGRC